MGQSLRRIALFGSMCEYLYHDIERNPVRAGLVPRAEQWRWSSANVATTGGPRVDPGPISCPAAWLAYVHEPQTETEVECVRESLRRARPFGEPAWMAQAAERLSLQASLRPRRRPRRVR